MNRAITFGRGPNADVVISGDEYMSPCHCRIEQRDNGTYWIGDLGSTNGTWIKRGALSAFRIYGPTPLQPGDTIRIGRTQLPWEIPT